jgi:hypothetical protein
MNVQRWHKIHLTRRHTSMVRLQSAFTLALAGLICAAVVKRQSITPLTSTQINSYAVFTHFSAAAYCDPSTTLKWNCGSALHVILSPFLFPSGCVPGVFHSIPLACALGTNHYVAHLGHYLISNPSLSREGLPLCNDSSPDRVVPSRYSFLLM